MWVAHLAPLLGELARNARDLLPLVGVVILFQWLVVGEPLPELERRIGGVALILVGLTFFLRGLAMSLFPLGEWIAEELAQRGSLGLLLAFGFALGFGSTVAEPALAAVADQAAATLLTAGSGPGAGDAARTSMLLRYGAAFAVGLGVALGVVRIVRGWPVHWLVLPGYGLATAIAFASGVPWSGMVFDAAAAATSAINIPLMLALGVGLASVIRARSPLVDGFGLVALASLGPMLVLLVASLAFVRPG
jgi:hypothetical protein